MSILLHGKRFTRARLTIRENRAIVAIQETFDDGRSAFIIDRLLRSIMKEIVKFEIPILLLIVDVAPFFILGNMNMKRLDALRP